MERIIFHIDVNNAFLSWTAIYLLEHGYKVDIRKIPSIIGGDEKERRGVVLAKSPINATLAFFLRGKILFSFLRRTIDSAATRLARS